MADRNIKKPYSDRRWYDDPQAKVPLCGHCKHRGPYNYELEIMPCKAFPDGIPREILKTCKGERDVNKECGRGVKFELKKEKK